MFGLRGPFIASFFWQLNASNDLKWISCFLSFLSSFIFNKELPCWFCSCFTLCMRGWKCCVPQTCQKSSCHQKEFDILIPKWLHLQSCLAGRTPIVSDQLLNISSTQHIPSVPLKLNLEQFSWGNIVTNRYPSCPEPLTRNVLVSASTMLPASQAWPPQVKRDTTYVMARYGSTICLQGSQSCTELLILTKGGRDRWAGEKSWRELLTVLLGVIHEKFSGGFRYSTPSSTQWSPLRSTLHFKLGSLDSLQAAE